MWAVWELSLLAKFDLPGDFWLLGMIGFWDSRIFGFICEEGNSLEMGEILHDWWTCEKEDFEFEKLWVLSIIRSLQKLKVQWKLHFLWVSNLKVLKFLWISNLGFLSWLMNMMLDATRSSPDDWPISLFHQQPPNSTPLQLLELWPRLLLKLNLLPTPIDCKGTNEREEVDDLRYHWEVVGSFLVKQRNLGKCWVKST